MIKLTMKAGPMQYEFERICTNELGLNPGIFAISEDGHKYLNRNVNWLWIQYTKSKGIK